MIEVMVMDIDGSLTDGKLYIGPYGETMKAFNVKDGLAIHKLHKSNIIPVFLTGRHSDIVKVRAAELGIHHVYQGVENKLLRLKEISQALNIPLENFAYFGDDENDLMCMTICGLTGCPYDAAPEVKSICDFVSSHTGGDGALREFVDFLLQDESE